MLNGTPCPTRGLLCLYNELGVIVSPGGPAHTMTTILVTILVNSELFVAFPGFRLAIAFGKQEGGGYKDDRSKTAALVTTSHNLLIPINF